MAVPREIKQVSYDFSGEVVLVTGAARGQGRAHAIGFAEAGADVAIADIGHGIETIPYELSSAEDLEAVKAEIEALGVRCHSVLCDVREAEQVNRMVASTVDALGSLDVLVCNAGTESSYRFQDLEEPAWEAIIDTHLRGGYLCSRAAARQMERQGRGKILVTGSVNSFTGLPRNAHYVTAKHGLLGLVRSLALELGSVGIRVNLVCPGAVDTPMITGMYNDTEQEFVDGLGAVSGVWNVFDPDEIMAPEEITNAMLWLASDAADYVTGTALVVDAGYLTK